MSTTPRTPRKGNRPERHITVRAIRRDQPDVRKLSRAIIALAMAQAEAEAEKAKDGTDEPATDANQLLESEGEPDAS
jgi:hypothetical protein